MNSLKELQKYNQAIWLDYIGRSLITSGELQRLVEDDRLRGVTNNPTIFEKAIVGGSDYDAALYASSLRTLTPTPGRSMKRRPSRISGWLPTSFGPSTTTRKGATAL